MGRCGPQVHRERRKTVQQIGDATVLSRHEYGQRAKIRDGNE